LVSLLTEQVGDRCPGGERNFDVMGVAVGSTPTTASITSASMGTGLLLLGELLEAPSD
jgi:hypothetical protein